MQKREFHIFSIANIAFEVTLLELKLAFFVQNFPPI
jgi:hypothetical protein